MTSYKTASPSQGVAKNRSRIYKIWNRICYICHNPNSADYPKFGGKGVKVCDRWRNSFDQFLDDVGEPESPDHFLRRIDLSGDWEPSNCEWKVRFGWHKTRVYSIWDKMKARCYNPKQKGYERYGGRGIRVCDRWHDFQNFLEDMGEPPTDRHSIDRIDNDGNYEPGNCRWATPKEQANNMSTTTFLEFDKERLSLSDWAEKTGINKKILAGRLRDGWSVEKALSTPVAHKPAKLTESDISEIRARYTPLCSANGKKALSREYRVRITTISEIVSDLEGRPPVRSDRNLRGAIIPGWNSATAAPNPSTR